MKKLAIFLSILIIPITLKGDQSVHKTSVDERLEDLEKKIHTLRMKIMKSEVESQSYLPYEWGQYTHEIEKAEHREKVLKELEAEYNNLLKLKQKENSTNN